MATRRREIREMDTELLIGSAKAVLSESEEAKAVARQGLIRHFQSDASDVQLTAGHLQRDSSESTSN